MCMVMRNYIDQVIVQILLLLLENHTLGPVHSYENVQVAYH
jgi:hypothetical protein